MLPTLLRRQQRNALDRFFYDDMNHMIHHLFKETEGDIVREPKVDIHEDDASYYIDAELPGVDKKDIQLHVEEDVLTLSGSRDDQKEDNKQAYFRLERQTGKFQRQFTFGDHVDYASIEATFNNGVLTVSIPKKEKAKPTLLDIKIK